jgi:hypothetical protein
MRPMRPLPLDPRLRLIYAYYFQKWNDVAFTLDIFPLFREKNTSVLLLFSLQARYPETETHYLLESVNISGRINHVRLLQFLSDTLSQLKRDISNESPGAPCFIEHLLQTARLKWCDWYLLIRNMSYNGGNLLCIVDGGGSKETRWAPVPVFASHEEMAGACVSIIWGIFWDVFSILDLSRHTLAACTNCRFTRQDHLSHLIFLSGEKPLKLIKGVVVTISVCRHDDACSVFIECGK